MGKPAVSIIVPVYRVEDFLDRCVNSLLGQTKTDIEVILVDDESPDGCPAMCDEYARRDPRVRVVHKKNGGLGMACNSGLEVASGEFVAFCDSDDWVAPEMYADMYDAAMQENADVVYTGLERHNGVNAIGRLPHPGTTETFENKSEIETLMMDMVSSAPEIAVERRIQVSAKVVLYRKEIIDKYDIRFESERKLISEDLLFNLDYLNKARKAIVLPRYYYHYYVNENSITNNSVKDKKHDFENFHIHILSRYARFKNNTEFRNRADRLFIGYMRSYMGFIVNNTSMRAADKLTRIGDMCSSPNWRIIEARYPISVMPVKHRLVLKLILGKRRRMLYALFRLFC